MSYCIFLRRLLSRFHMVFLLSEIFPTYNSCLMSRLLRPRSSISMLTLLLSLSSLYLSFVPDLSLRICSAAFPVPSRGTIDVSIPVGRCSLAFAIVSACSKSAGVVCLAVLCLPRAFLSICFSIFLYLPSFSISLLSLFSESCVFLVSKSMSRVLSVERV